MYVPRLMKGGPSPPTPKNPQSFVNWVMTLSFSFLLCLLWECSVEIWNNPSQMVLRLHLWSPGLQQFFNDGKEEEWLGWARVLAYWHIGI